MYTFSAQQMYLCLRNLVVAYWSQNKSVSDSVWFHFSILTAFSVSFFQVFIEMFCILNICGSGQIYCMFELQLSFYDARFCVVLLILIYETL